MKKEDRIVALEREVLARSLELDAKDADEETARLYRLIASAVRNCNENA